MSVTEHLPAQLGPYRLEGRLGAGGMGVVYLARDPRNNQPVAIKVLRVIEDDMNARRRMVREVETMRRVRSPYVAEVLDADITGPAPYIVTRYVPGVTLDEMVSKNGPLSGNGTVRLAIGLATALDAIHAAGVVHRDLKPGNVMMTDDRPVVIDFGIAQPPEATRLTQTGMVMGTPGYLAPELIQGAPASSASDVFAWAATVAFAATGRAPFGEGSFETIFFRVISGNFDLNGVPGAIADLLGAALATDPARRPPASWLAAAASGQVSASGLAAYLGTAAVPTRTAAPLSSAGAGARGTKVMPPQMTPGPVPAGRRLLPRGPIGRADIPSDGRTPFVPAARRPPGTVKWLPGLAFAVAAAALTIVLPVAGLVAGIAAVTLLRAVDLPRQRAYLAPLTFLRSALTTVLIAPLALAAGAFTWIVTIALTHHPATPQAPAYAAAAFVTTYTLGPGSRRPRHALHRLLGPFARTPVSALAGTIATWALAAAVVTLAISQQPYFWPAVLPHGLPHIAQFPHLPGTPRFPAIHFPKLHPPSVHSLLSSTANWFNTHL